jgi:signal transduction histidine kinase
MDWFSTLTGIAIGLLLIVWRGKPNPESSSEASSEASSGAKPAQTDRITQAAYYAALDLAQFKGSFLSRTSHELRSPLNALISSLQMIEAGLCDDPEEEKEYIGLAHDGAMKFIGMLDEVLKVSKLQSGRLDLATKEVDLAMVLQEVYFMTRHLAANRNLKLEIPMLEDEVLIQADPLYLQQALTILVSRSIEAMEEGSIVLTLKPQEPIVLTLTAELPADQWEDSLSVLKRPTASLPEPPKLKPGEALTIATEFSPSFRLLLARELLLLMGISLSVPNESIHSIECRFERANG